EVLGCQPRLAPAAGTHTCTYIQYIGGSVLCSCLLLAGIEGNGCPRGSALAKPASCSAKCAGENAAASCLIIVPLCSPQSSCYPSVPSVYFFLFGGAVSLYLLRTAEPFVIVFVLLVKPLA
uniref:Uncharacterized protein n=1 Tax=Aegilops tauschii subsp. strangulata TaxID=200361 RepID=A0A453SEQ0_AEGTS